MKSQQGFAVVAALLGAARCFRIKRTGVQETASTRSIAGVPVQNYQADGQDWVVMSSQVPVIPRSMLFVQDDIHGDDGVLEKMLSQQSDAFEHAEFDAMYYATSSIEEVDAATTASWGLERVGVPSRANAGAGVDIYCKYAAAAPRRVPPIARAMARIALAPQPAMPTALPAVPGCTQ